MKGLRQGDPLSPYLFVLCMEILSNMISHLAYRKSWKGVSITKSGPCLTHLFFVDDHILFANADPRHGDLIATVMEEFSFISGLQINFQKSKLFVSPNIDRRKVRELSSLCNIPLTTDLGKYLGVPILH